MHVATVTSPGFCLHLARHCASHAASAAITESINTAAHKTNRFISKLLSFDGCNGVAAIDQHIADARGALSPKVIFCGLVVMTGG
jgi:hypothetical protein